MGGATDTAALPVAPADTAVIVAWPLPCARTRPVESTPATCSLLVRQTNALPGMGLALASAPRGQANRVSHDERSDTRRHHDGGDILPHRDKGLRDAPRSRRDRRLAPAVRSHKARGVNACHLLVTRAPDECAARNGVAIGIARLSGQANGVSHDERSDTRRHHDGGDILPHRDPGVVRDGLRSGRDRRRSRGNRPRDAGLGNRGDRRIRTGPGYVGAGHGATLLISHFCRQSHRVSERREQDGLRRDRQRGCCGRAGGRLDRWIITAGGDDK